MNYRISSSLLAIAIVLPGCASRPPVNRETRLNGAGSTFAYPLYLKWANDRQPQLLTFAGRRDEKGAGGYHPDSVIERPDP